MPINCQFEFRNLCTVLKYQLAISVGFITTRIYVNSFQLDTQQHPENLWIVFTVPVLIVLGCCGDLRILLGFFVLCDGFMLTSIISYYIVCLSFLL